MILDILKNSELWERLEVVNDKILEISNNFKYYNGDEFFEDRVGCISSWFDPKQIKAMPTAWCYPEIDPNQMKAEYSLVLFPANYLTLFLLDKLYKHRTGVSIQDIGSGVGHFVVYAHLLGFNNFNLIENFSQISKESQDQMLGAFPKINYSLNTISKPVIINNVGRFDGDMITTHEETELVCVNTDESAVLWFENTLTKRGFVFLCRDKDNFQIVYCRQDKYEEFKLLLSDYQATAEPTSIPQYQPTIGRLERKAVNDYMENPGFLTEYKKTTEFENQISEYLKVDHTIVVNNGTISLSLALLAGGIKPGDKVIVPNLTMIATLNAVRLIGAEPVLVDVDKGLLLDWRKARPLINSDPRIRAVIFVSLNGRWYNSEDHEFVFYCQNKQIDVAGHLVRQVLLIQDAAQSFGSQNWALNRMGAENWFDITSFSFSMPKIITCGQGGCLTTNSAELASKLRKLKDFGRSEGGIDIHDDFGINSKFTELQAVIGLEQLKDMEYRIRKKKHIYKIYRDQLSSIPEIEFINTNLDYTVPWFVDIFVKDPQGLSTYLKERGIGTRLMYPPLNIQKVNQGKFNCSESFPVSADYCSRGLWLPSSFTLTDRQVNKICDFIKEYYGQS